MSVFGTPPPMSQEIPFLLESSPDNVWRYVVCSVLGAYMHPRNICLPSSLPLMKTWRPAGSIREPPGTKGMPGLIQIIAPQA